MQISRRALLEAGLLGGLGVAARPAAAQAQSPSPAPAHSILWYDKPAAQWVEALPVGNGRLGAMVFGQIKRERLQLNEDTLWAGGPYRNANPKAREALPRLRQLIFEGRYAEAEALANNAVQGVPMREMSFLSVGDLYIDLQNVDETSATGYRRELDLDAAVARTRFTSEGVTYVREVIASPVDNVIAVSVTAGGHPIDLDLTCSTGLRAEISPEEPATLVMAGRGNSEHGNPGRLRFEARAQVLAQGGTVQSHGPAIEVRGASSVVILLAIATSFKTPDDVSGDPAAITRAQLAAAGSKPFARLLDEHRAEHRRLFRRVSIDLGAGKGADRPTNVRVEHASDSNDPSLASLYFQFGRYLLICCSRPGTQPANLQGLWNESNKPPWSSNYTININTQMNYWPADPANLGECIEPLIRFIGELAETGAHTAREMYGARGWVAHHNSDLWRVSGPVDYARTGLWPTGGAWLATHLWDHYDYGRDLDFLKRAYPLMRGAALFFLDTLVEDPRTGYMVTNPSLSPENDHGRGSTLCAGPAMDMQILRDLFDQTLEAARILRSDPELRAELAGMRARLAPDKIGASGHLQEWQFDWDETAADIHHRHVSHLYGLFPSQQINVDETPALARAARKTLDVRGDDATGWGIGWRLNLWAHLRDAEHAHKILIMLLGPERTYPNLFDAHPPFQIDGNFGGVRGIIEMLVQSRKDFIDLLPALPAAWPTGAIRGIRLRGACEIDLSWREGQVSDLTLRSRIGGKRTLRTGRRELEVTLRKDRPLRLSGDAFG